MLQMRSSLSFGTLNLFLKGRQEGRFIYYAPSFATVNGLVDYLTENCCQGASCVVACVPSPQAKRRRAS